MRRWTSGPGPLLLGLGVVAAAAAFTADGSAAVDAARRAWPPFVLVTGLLLVGVVAHDDGLFDAVAARLERRPALRAGRRPDGRLLVALLLVVAATTAVLNLDTSVAFLTPILVLAARRRGAAEEPFLYGAVFMSNAASLLLPGSNLTNLLVLAGSRVNGAAFAACMAPAWLAAVAVTSAVLLHRLRRAAGEGPVRGTAAPDNPEPIVASGEAGSVGLEPWVRWSLGAVATIAAGGLVLAVPAPAIPVLVVGLGAAAVRLWGRRLSPEGIVEAVGPAALVGVYGIAVGLGTLAASWTAPARLVARSGPAAAAVVGTAAAVTVNNLPAAVLLAPHRPAHPEGLLLGLNLGPNLAVTGSLSALLWYQAARRVGARPSARTYSKIGLALVPLSIAAALAALALTPGGGF